MSGAQYFAQSLVLMPSSCATDVGGYDWLWQELGGGMHRNWKVWASSSFEIPCAIDGAFSNLIWPTQARGMGRASGEGRGVESASRC